MALEQKLEALLFYKGEPETKKRLAKLLDCTLEEIEEAASKLTNALATRGVRLLKVNDQLELVTSPETTDVVNSVRKEELTRDLGKAGSETLSVILYRGPVTRADIEYIRGVNCSFILRNLLIRGLVERVPNPKNSRSVLYQPTPDILKYLGVATVQDLPNYDEVLKEMDTFEAEAKQAAEESEQLEEKTTV